MSNPLIRECDYYVVLEPGKAQRILSSKETLLWLEACLHHIELLPYDLTGMSSLAEAAQFLLDTACDLEIFPGHSVKWFAIRLDSEND